MADRRVDMDCFLVEVHRRYEPLPSCYLFQSENAWTEHVLNKQFRLLDVLIFRGWALDLDPELNMFQFRSIA